MSRNSNSSSLASGTADLTVENKLMAAQLENETLRRQLREAQSAAEASTRPLVETREAIRKREREEELADAQHTADLGRDSQHWSFFLDSNASVLEGNDWRLEASLWNLPDLFRVTAVNEGYSPLDLYLMGFYSIGEVPDFFYITVRSNPLGFTPDNPPFSWGTVFGSAVTVSIQDVRRAVGAREEPGGVPAPTTFRQAWILLVERCHSGGQCDLPHTHWSLGHGRWRGGHRDFTTQA